jgi:putative ABC transport system substrate-binding protein
MRRREFITLVIGAAASRPLTVLAQQSVPVIGFLSRASAKTAAANVAAFVKGLNETGFDEGRNVAIEYRWADDQYERLPELAADLVARRVAVIAAMGGGIYSTVAAKAATTTIPIIFEMGEDPVKFGLVASLNRPGGNVTGITQFATTLEAKKLGLLTGLVPSATTIGILVNRSSPSIENELKDVQEAAATLKLQVCIVGASTAQEVETAFASLAQQHVGALLVAGDPFLFRQSDQLVALAKRYAIPTIYTFREVAVAGGLMTYAPSLVEAYRQTGSYAGRVLKGEKPADLPVIQPTKFEFVINLKTAKTLGLTVPPGLLAIADEVIE